jgi:prepilin-type N-terminal cleavage/methylation domain-containing protein
MRLGNRGDTIIEIMIVLAILALAISVAYSTASRSLLNARQAHENTEATRLAETQIERLRLMRNNPAAGPDNIYTTAPKLYCVNSTNNKININTNDPYAPLATDDTGGCTQLGRYFVSVCYKTCSNPLDDRTFTVMVTWDDVLGQGKDSVRIPYRLPAP